MTYKKLNSLLLSWKNCNLQIAEARRVLKKNPENLFLSIWCDDDDESIDFGQYTVDDKPFQIAAQTYIKELLKKRKELRNQLRKLEAENA